jgi:hypothetical protein
LLIGVIFLLDAMAACPVLHEMIHHDAGKEDHDCAVTMLVSGKIDSVTCDIIVPPPPILIETTRHFTISVGFRPWQSPRLKVFLKPNLYAVSYGISQSWVRGDSRKCFENFNPFNL